METRNSRVPSTYSTRSRGAESRKAMETSFVRHEEPFQFNEAGGQRAERQWRREACAIGRAPPSRSRGAESRKAMETTRGKVGGMRYEV